MAALTAKRQQIPMAAISIYDTGESAVQIAAVQIPVNDFRYIRTPETVLQGEMIVIDQDEGLKIAKYPPIG